MEALPADALHCILASLGYRDLLAASSACRHLRTAAAADSELWRNMCLRRWHRSSLNAPLFTLPRQQLDGDQHLRPDYKSLFTSGNGWAAPRFVFQRYAGPSPPDELVAMRPSIGEDGTTIAVSSRRELRILELGSCPSARLQVLRAANVQQDSGQESWISVASIGSEGLVAAGGASGRLAAFQLPEAASGAPSPHSVAATATLAAPGNSCAISQLHVMPGQRLAALRDRLAVQDGTAQQRHSALSVIDVPTWQHVTPSMADVLDGYELAAVVPAGNAGNAGNELVAGSVKLSDHQATSGWPCTRCSLGMHGSLCFHKSPASSAALCMFDLRAQQPMVARYSTQHRSLYPHLELVRDHFLLTSHAGLPVAVWDRRQMNAPVYEVHRLSGEVASAGGLPLDDPVEYELPTSQALHLSATSDMLLGRADSGMCWVWDLSECLGWRDGSEHGGSWLRAAQQPRDWAWTQPPGDAPAAMEAALDSPGTDCDEGHCDDECSGQPLPLGCIPPPYEVWRVSQGDDMAQPHWLPPPAAWLAHNRLLALGGLEPDELQDAFFSGRQKAKWPCNALIVASLHREGR